MTISLLNLIRLQSIPGVGTRTLDKILEWCDHDDDRIAAFFALDAETLKREFTLRDNAIKALAEVDADQARQTLEKIESKGFRLIAAGDKDYPVQMTAILDDSAPLILYVRGDVALMQKAGVAFSGSRQVSEQGTAHAESLARQTVDRGLTVISGGAKGVDVTAHKTALDHGGKTIVVLAEGALNFRLHADLRDYADSDRLLVITEFAPKMTWAAGNAMVRNRTILSLARALCVIEAGDSGGTLDAGRAALELGLPTFVLDYPDPPPSAVGNKLLLSEGAIPIRVADGVELPEIPDRSEHPNSTHLSGQLPLF
ncbi:MAG: DNA-processing protein DprA [Anaerolineae bacterium]